MVEKKLIQDTIIELMDANVDKNTIYSTLKDIGVGLDDIESNYKEILEERENTKEPDQEEKQEKEDQINQDQKEEEITQEDDIFNQDTKENKKTTKTDFLEQNRSRNHEKIEDDFKETTSQVDKINNNFTEKSNSKNIDLNTDKKIEDIQEQIRDIKAQLNGLTKIMKDILNENRNILSKL